MKTFLIASVLLGNFFMSFICKAQLSDVLMLTVSCGTYSDQTAIRFLDVATDRFDSEWDAYKPKNLGNTPNFCSNVYGQTYSINALHGSGASINKKVSLNLEVAFSEVYTITAEQIGLFDSLCTITLVDRLLRTQQDLKTNATYSFNFHVGDPVDRFAIYVKAHKPTEDHKSHAIASADLVNVDQNDLSQQGTQQALEGGNQEVRIYNSQGSIFVQFDRAQSSPEINISDLSGNSIVHTTISASSTGNVWTFTPNKTDLYIVNLMLDGKLYSEKVYLQ